MVFYSKVFKLSQVLLKRDLIFITRRLNFTIFGRLLQDDLDNESRLNLLKFKFSQNPRPKSPCSWESSTTDALPEKRIAFIPKWRGGSNLPRAHWPAAPQSRLSAAALAWTILSLEFFLFRRTILTKCFLKKHWNSLLFLAAKFLLLIGLLLEMCTADWVFKFLNSSLSYFLSCTYIFCSVCTM